METTQTQQLEVGREYALRTFYGFKTGPHSAKYLGRASYRNYEREFFRENEGVGGITTYFVLRDPKLANEVSKKAGLPVVEANLKDLEGVFNDQNIDDVYEMVFRLDNQNNFIDDPLDVQAKERPKMLTILRDFGEKI